MIDPWLYVIATTKLELIDPKQKSTSISTIGFKRNWTFVEVAAKILDLGPGTSTKIFGHALIENGHTMAEAQCKKMVEATERGEKTGIGPGGHFCYCFGETGREDEPVCIFGISPMQYSCRLGDKVPQRLLDWFWDRPYDVTDYQLLIANLDVSKL